MINFIFPAVRFETWEGCEEYLAQAVHCATLIHDYKLNLQEGGLLLERLGVYYYQRGCYTDAETYLTQALHLQEDNSRSDPSDVAQTLNSLALLYQELARYLEAETLYQRSLEIRERLLGLEHPKTAESLHNLAMLHGDRGNYQEARRLYLRVLALEEHAKGADHPDVASTLNNLALISYQQGRYSEAEATYRRAAGDLRAFFTSRSSQSDLSPRWAGDAWRKNKGTTSKPRNSINEHWTSQGKHLEMSMLKPPIASVN